MSRIRGLFVVFQFAVTVGFVIAFMYMFKKIKKSENAKKWILDALENKKLIYNKEDIEIVEVEDLKEENRQIREENRVKNTYVV